jgi:crossover junction endodeoxyribonuclease RusA
MSTTIRIDLPWTSPPVSQNDRQHHHAKAKAVALALAEARMAIRAARVDPIVGAVVTLHYRAPDHRRRDADNLAVVLKVVQDALVAEEVLPRDDWVHVPSSGQQIHPPTDEGPALWVELTDVTYFESEGA